MPVLGARCSVLRAARPAPRVPRPAPASPLVSGPCLDLGAASPGELDLDLDAVPTGGVDAARRVGDDVAGAELAHDVVEGFWQVCRGVGAQHTAAGRRGEGVEKPGLALDVLGA